VDAAENYMLDYKEFDTSTLPSSNLVRESQCPGCLENTLSVVHGREFLSCCNCCGLIFDNPRPTPELILAYYNRADQYDSWLKDLDRRRRLWLRRIRKMRAHGNPGSLLDIGTGIGQFLSLASAEYSPVTGTEISSRAIELANRLYGLDILNGTIESLAISRQFDNITAFHVLEHVHWPFRFLQRCGQLLKKGGRLFLAVPNELEKLGAGTKKRALAPVTLLTPEIHLSHWTSQSLASLLSKHGFETLHVSLDPFWVASRSRECFQWIRYFSMTVMHKVTANNVYPTIWVVAQKPK
jgi:SAM-dependent methyltransferase